MREVEEELVERSLLDSDTRVLVAKNGEVCGVRGRLKGACNTWKNKEHESNLTEYRLAAGLTVLELCGKLGIKQMTYSGLNSGSLAPVNYRGVVSENAYKLAEFFGADLSDLFPRYFCTVPQAGLLDDQIIGCFQPEFLDADRDDPELVAIRMQLRRMIVESFNGMKKAEKVVFQRRLLDDDTLDDIGKDMEVSRERVRQIEENVKAKLRKRLKEFCA